MSRVLRGLHIAGASALIYGATGGTGCATSQYTQQVVARGELSLRYDGQFELSTAGQPVARGLLYRGLAQHVRCVEEARVHAKQAATNGRLAIASSVIGGVMGVGGLLPLVAFADQTNWVAWVVGGLAADVVGLSFAILSWRSKNHANGHAIDAMNYYNDRVGSLGATCDDLAHQAPLAPMPAAVTTPAPNQFDNNPNATMKPAS